MVTCSCFLVLFIVAYGVQDVQTVTLEVHAQEAVRISTSIDTSADAGSDTSIDIDIDTSADTVSIVTSVTDNTSVTDTIALCAAPHAGTIGYARYEGYRTASLRSTTGISGSKGSTNGTKSLPPRRHAARRGSAATYGAQRPGSTV